MSDSLRIVLPIDGADQRAWLLLKKHKIKPLLELTKRGFTYTAYSADTAFTYTSKRLFLFVAAYSAGHALIIHRKSTVKFVAAYSAGHNEHIKNNGIKSIVKSETPPNTIINKLIYFAYISIG